VALMLLRCRKRLLPPAVFLVGKKCGMNLPVSCHAHKESVIVLVRLVNSADARRGGRTIHRSPL
jgi:hypothetical protein